MHCTTHITVSMILVFLSSQALCRETDYCYAQDDDPYLKFATKSPYFFVHGKTRFSPVPNCSPMQIWVLSRHGTRYPGKDKIKMMKTLPKLRDQIRYNHETRGYGHLCETDLKNLIKWDMNAQLNEDNANKLSEQGEEDMKLLARRLKSNFPELFPPDTFDVSSNNYKFRSTSKQRTQDSMKSFMEGLFDNPFALRPEETPKPDYLLNAHKDCSHWVNTTDSTKAEILKQQQIFIEGPEFQNVLRNVSRRLGFQHNISSASVLLMYEMCRTEKSLYVSEISVWCAVFSKEELRVLEYSEDIEYYYYDGHGREINKNIGCFPLQDMFRHFKKLEGRQVSNEPKGIFYFAHSTTILTLISTMDMKKDSEPLTAFNYREMGKREWQTSYISPYAANLVAVFYKCNDNLSPNKVLFYLSEKPVLYEGCEVGLCDWEYLKNKLVSVASDCSANFCTQAAGVATFYPNFALSILLILTLYSTLPKF